MDEQVDHALLLTVNRYARGVVRDRHKLARTNLVRLLGEKDSFIGREFVRAAIRVIDSYTDALLKDFD